MAALLRKKLALGLYYCQQESSGEKSAQFLSIRTGYLGTNYPDSDRIEINNLKQ